jgi:DNA polymerase III delta prime subunit
MKILSCAAMLSLFIGSNIVASAHLAKEFAKELNNNPITVKVQPDFSKVGEGMGEAIGTAIGQAIEQGIEQGAKGFANAANDDQFRDNLKEGFTGIGTALTDAGAGVFENKEVRDGVRKTAKAATSLANDVTAGFADSAKNSQVGKNVEEGLKHLSEDVATATANAANNPELQKQAKRGGKGLAKTMNASAQGVTETLTQKGGIFDCWEQLSQRGIGSFFNYRNAMQFALPTATGTIIVLSAYYGPKVFWKVLEQRLLTPKPAILLPGSKYGRKDRLHRWWAGYKTPPMIFDASVKERLEEIEEKTRNIRDHIYQGQKITYDNLLLYGNPGTGKTLFAEILADKTNMDILKVTAASLLQSGVEGIKYFDELITMANKSRYGVIIFVDEADALFVDRDTLKPDSDHYKVLNHILAITGSGSNKFMLIAATNHAYVMDPAMGRRFQDRILMPLPDANTRKELLSIYMDEQLFNEKNRSAEFISAASSILTNAKIKSIVEQTAGLSHAEIKDMVTIMGKKANATKDGIITRRNVDTAVSEAVEKKKALEKDLLEREQKMSSKGS